MTVDEYAVIAKESINKFVADWKEHKKETPEAYPENLEQEVWEDQELSGRFGKYL